MIRETTCTGACSRLAALMDQVIDTREPVLIRRHGKEPVALVAADELAGWTETAYLLRSPKNARRLRKAAVESRLVGESLRRLWDDLDETQRFAVSEALHDPESGFHPERFKAKYGALPAGFGRLGTPESSLLRLLLRGGNSWGSPRPHMRRPWGPESNFESRLKGAAIH